MAPAINKTDMATVTSDANIGDDDGEDLRVPIRGPGSEKPHFFTIYKKGQGYWTRLGTAFCAILIVGLIARFVWSELPVYVTWFAAHPGAKLGLIGGVLAALGLFAWRLMNKPDHVEFLIATDSEMKKVNWTSREELVGSTKVVILFMVVIALLLFVTDVVFGYLFYWIGVLKSPPF